MSKSRVAVAALLTGLCFATWTAIFLVRSKLHERPTGAPFRKVERSERLVRFEGLTTSYEQPGAYERLERDNLQAMISRVPMVNVATSGRDQIAATTRTIAEEVCELLAFETGDASMLETITVMTFPNGTRESLKSSLSRSQLISPNFCWEKVNLSSSCFYICHPTDESMEVLPDGADVLARHPHLDAEPENHFIVLSFEIGDALEARNHFQLEFVHDVNLDTLSLLEYKHSNLLIAEE